MMCPRCFLEVAAQGVVSHQRGRRCEVKTSIRENRDAGLAPVARRYKKWLDEAGLKYNEAPVRFIDGFKGRASQIIYALWTAPEVAEAIQLRTIGVPSFVGFVPLSVKDVKAKLVVLARRSA